MKLEIDSAMETLENAILDLQENLKTIGECWKEKKGHINTCGMNWNSSKTDWRK